MHRILCSGTTGNNTVGGIILKGKRKDIDKIPTDWKLVLILLGFGAFPFIFNFCFSVLGFSYSKTRAVIRGEATLLTYFILGLIFLVSYTFDETGITSRYLGIPIRKIRWTPRTGPWQYNLCR